MGIVRETTPGTTPTTPRIRTMRITGESLQFNPTYVDSDEIRSDRMNNDPILVFQDSSGSLNFELSYPDDSTPLAEIFRSAFMNPWVETPTRDNDGVADSVITAVATAGTVVTVTTGAAFVAGQLVQFSGFGVAANNGIFKVTTGSATVPAFVGSGITDEAVPPAAAKMKVVGFVGAAADITATATGLGSTALNFTTLGLVVGQWIKIGGTAAGDKFATAALNDWMRITAITATALTLDNRPTGWTTDAGAGKTIKVWFGDQIRNGTLETAFTVERGFLGQTTPVYIVTKGMHVNSLSLNFLSKQKITGVAALMGMGGSESTATLDAAYDAATTNVVMAANSNVGRLAENGATLTSPNWARSFDFTINNNLRQLEDVSSISPPAVREGEATVTGKIESYFGDDTLLAKFYAGTATAINARVSKNSQAMIFQVPRATLRGGGNPSATAKNTDVMTAFDYQASIDPLTSSHILADRLTYFEA